MADIPEFKILNNEPGPFLSSNPSAEEMEATCTRCGVSCGAVVELDDRLLIVDGLHCSFAAFDGKIWACTVYKHRHTVPWCCDNRKAAQIGALSEDCPYVEGTDGYIGKVKLPTSEYRALWPRILHEIRSRVWESWWNLDEYAEYLTAHTPGVTWSFLPDEENPGGFYLHHNIDE